MNRFDPRAASVLLVLIAACGAPAAEPVSETLISVEENIREWNWEYKGETEQGTEFPSSNRSFTGASRKVSML